MGPIALAAPRRRRAGLSRAKTNACRVCGAGGLGTLKATWVAAGPMAEPFYSCRFIPEQDRAQFLQTSEPESLQKDLGCRKT